jgi:hypothetical protein
MWRCSWKHIITTVSDDQHIVKVTIHVDDASHHTNSSLHTLQLLLQASCIKRAETMAICQGDQEVTSAANLPVI